MAASERRGAMWRGAEAATATPAAAEPANVMGK